MQVQNLRSSDRLRDGVEEEMLRNTLSENDVSNQEVFELYRYCNGSNYSIDQKYNGIEFCSFGYLLAMEDGLEIYNSDTLQFRKNALFPIFANFAGDYILISANEKEHSVYIYSPGLFIVKSEIIFESLMSLLSAIHQCYVSKAYTLSDNQLIVDMDAENDIFCRDKIYSEWSS